jgi:DENN (AEX-3) domain
VLFVVGWLELPLLDYPLRQLFLLLGVETVLVIVTGVMLERQILFYSQGNNIRYFSDLYCCVADVTDCNCCLHLWC